LESRSSNPQQLNLLCTLLTMHLDCSLESPRKSGVRSASLSVIFLTLGSRDPSGLFHTKNSKIRHPAEGEHGPGQAPGCRAVQVDVRGQSCPQPRPLKKSCPLGADTGMVRRSRGCVYFPGLYFGVMEVLTLCMLTELM